MLHVLGKLITVFTGLQRFVMGAKMNVICIIFVLITFLGFSIAGDGGDVTVNAKAGTFIGFATDVVTDSKTVQIDNFFGIPYAEPPTADLRFRKPVPKGILKEPLVTQKHGPECIQVKLLPPEGPTSEDCLYLNVYAPRADQEGDRKAVMVWIYGGGFITGSANIYNSATLAATGDVIVVTFNYRVTAMGFLNVGDSNAPGNYGLWDQHLAIQWVHDNIEAFGGDAERITIFGESAGSASVIYQGLYPGNKGLFQRIVAQSGAPTGPWAHTRNAVEEAKELAALVGCGTAKIKDMTECLRLVPSESIETALNSKFLRYPFAFVPSVDGEFVKQLPTITFDLEENAASEERSTFASFDLIIGTNYAEGGTYVSPFFGVLDNPNEFKPSRSHFENVLVPLRVEFDYGKNARSLLSEMVVAEYTDWSDPENPLAIRDQFVAMHGDIAVVAPLHATVNLYLNGSQKFPFVYHFTAEPLKHIAPVQWIKKAIHADDMIYLFGSREVFKSWGAAQDEFTCLEEELSKTIMTMWTNFAKTGNPNEPSDVSVNWPSYTTEKHSYLELSKSMNSDNVKERLDERRANFWNILMPKVVKTLSYSGRSMYDGTCGKEEDCVP